MTNDEKGTIDMGRPTTHTETTTPSRHHRWRALLAGAAIVAVGATSAPFATAASASTVPEAVVDASTDPTVEAAIDQLRASGLWSDTDGPVDIDPATLEELAGEFGITLFNAFVDKGVSLGTDELLRLLGYDSQTEMKQALDEIRASLDHLNAQVQHISEQLEQVLDGQDRANFYGSYTKAGKAAGRLSIALASVSAWQATGAQPSQADVAAMRTVVLEAISDLTFVATNSVTGTIPLMMRAVEPGDVSDLDGWLDDVDVTRNDYRAVLAQGLTTLDLLSAFDEGGTVRSDLDALLPVAANAVETMYAYGLDVDGPGGEPFAQARHSDTMLAAWRASLTAAERAVWTQTTNPNNNSAAALRRDVVEPVLAKMAATWRPSLHGGQTLEQWMNERGLPTSVVYTDSFWIDKITTGGGLARYTHYDIVAVVGQVKGNNYYTWEHIAIDRRHRAYKETWTPWDQYEINQEQKAASDAWAAERIRQLSTWASTGANAWANLKARDGTPMGVFEGRMLIGEPTNGVAGYWVDLDPDRIAEAAFGTT